MKLEHVIVAAVLSGSQVSSTGAQAADWPSEPIQLIVAWAPGGGTDRVARALAPVLEEQLGVSVPIINRTGGTGVVGHTVLAQASPDGSTIGFITPQLLTGPILGLTDLTYEDLQPLAMINADPGAVTVGAEAPWATLEEFVQSARDQPGTIRVGNSGPGGTWHMVAVGLEREAGLDLVHTPYDGAAPAITDMLGGHIEAVTVSAVEVAPQVTGGLAKMLAVTADERLEAFPDVPTAAEQGIELDLGTWRGLGVPAGTPDEIVQRLEAAVEAAVQDERFRSFMDREGFGIRFLGSADFADFLSTQEASYEAFFEQAATD
jgi:tripartite-type tricarboxylate transporter receptor subunit TctC